ncbi:bifunctional metallophosphatase/5'-nucleotidase [Amphibiibacter pelophylacis]|uniref:5'-nucleotidase C-terminal domain-containing protein n=1 Tax=Amphibiibacter pelophylacis TaxID=1799477 RepID=A0ACC6NYG7_9BURK
MSPALPVSRGLSRRRTLTVGLALTTAALLAACGTMQTGSGGVAADGSMEVTLLHINDHHSHLEPTKRTLQLAIDGPQRVPVQVDVGGFPRIVTAMRELAEGQPNVIKIHAGDALSGSLYYNRAGRLGEADAALMDSVCFDSFTLGNHEFDKGDTALSGFLDELARGSCKTPVLSANTRFGAGSALGLVKGQDRVKKSVVLERSGQRIGIIGLTIAGKTKASSSPDKDTLFDDEMASAQAEINALRAQGVKRIVVASHIGYDMDLKLAKGLDGVDVIIGGDSHTLLGPDSLKTYGVGSPQGPYPTVVKNDHGNTVCVAQAWEYAQEVGQLKVRFDRDGQVLSCSGVPQVLVGDNFSLGKDKPALTDAQRRAIRADMAASGVLRPTAEDPQAVALLAPYKAKVASFSKTVVGTAPQELCSRRVPGGEGSTDYSRSSVECNAEGRVSQHGGDIQQLVVQAYLDIAKRDYGGADIALQSGGGARIPLKGDFTAANVLEVLPFGNQLFRLTLTGAEVKSMIEDGLEATFGPKGSTGPYPYTAGLRFAVDSKAARGQRASAFEVWSDSAQAWQPLEAAQSYRLFVLSFNANGGDGYTTLEKIPPERRLDVGVLDADVLQSYIDAQPKGASGLPELKRVPKDWMSTQSFK